MRRIFRGGYESSSMDPRRCSPRTVRSVQPNAALEWNPDTVLRDWSSTKCCRTSIRAARLLLPCRMARNWLCQRAPSANIRMYAL